MTLDAAAYVDAAFERLIDETAAPGDDYRNMRYIARLTLYRLPLKRCRKLFRNKRDRRILNDAFLAAIIAAQDVPPGGEVCRYPISKILSGDFFPYGDYTAGALYVRDLREEYERLAALAVSVGYAEQIDAYADGVPAEYIFQGDYTAPAFFMACGMLP
jgi:hypothetical protein